MPEIKAMDFNTIKIFHLQTPQELIYYSAGSNVLKVQTSTYFHAPYINTRKSVNERKSNI